MNIIDTEIPDVKIIEPKVFGDFRGFFYESFNHEKFEAAIGRKVNFVQDNHSKSVQGVLRGLHYQIQHPQGKLVRCTRGEVFDVAVDLRKSSLTFGKWVGVILSEENKRQLWIPEGFAHGFYVLSDVSEVLYKVTNYWDFSDECCIYWGDLTLGIRWPMLESPAISFKDAQGKSFVASKHFCEG